MRDHHADGPAPLALGADAGGRDVRRAPVQGRGDHLEQLALVDRAPVELEVDGDVRGDRRRGGEGGDVPGRCVDDREELLDVGEVAQRLDPPGRGAGADRDQRPRRAPHPPDAVGVGRRADRPLHQRQVVRPGGARAARLEEVGDLDLAGELEQLVLAVEQGELAPVAGGELPDRERRPAARLTAPSRPSAGRPGRTGRPGRRGRSSWGPAGSGRSGRARTACCAPARRGRARRGPRAPGAPRP